MEQMNLIISTVLIILGTFNIATLASPKKHDYPEFNSGRKVRIYYDALFVNLPTYQYFHLSSISGLYHTDGKIRILKAWLVE